MTGLDRALLYGRTVRYLRLAQVAHRLRLRAQKLAFEQMPHQLARRLLVSVPADVGWPEGFVPLDEQTAAGCAEAEANAGGRLQFLNDERQLGDPPAWEQPEAS